LACPGGAGHFGVAVPLGPVGVVVPVPGCVVVEMVVTTLGRWHSKLLPSG